MSEQVFISYRRVGGDITAKLICEALKNHGYTVFYDYDSLSGGYFDTRIFKAIKGCKDFVLVLPPNSLDRCVQRDDWVRQEIACALKHNKNIIPVLLPGFEFPKHLPADISDVARYNGVEFVMAYFDSTMDAIMDKMRSSPKRGAASAAPSRPTYEPAYEDVEEDDTPIYTPTPRVKPAKKARSKKTKAFVKPLIISLIALVLLALIGCFGVYPNLATDDLYTPEILQAYSGEYRADNMRGVMIFTFTSCDENGNVTGTLEFSDVKESFGSTYKTYGKYNITGTITKKSNNGNIQMTITPGSWIIHPEGYTPFSAMETILIKKNYQKLECKSYYMECFAGGDNEFSIKTAADLKKLSGSDEIFTLMNDIDLAGAEWTPIEGFTGTLIGNGYSIKNLKITSSESNVGFFSILDGNVQNLNFENATVEVSGRNENVGILCGAFRGDIISNISVSGTVKAEKSTSVGGICGLVGSTGNLTLGSMSNSATVTGLSCVGGCFGQVINSVVNGTNPYTMTLSNLKNSGAVTATEDWAGGITSYVMGEATGFTGSLIVTFVDCENTGSVTGACYVAGIVGQAESDTTSTIENCKNSAAITAKAYTGCIAGMAYPYIIKNCSNESSSLNATGYYMQEGERYAYVGGYVGYGICTENCTNYVDINYTGGGSFVGGLMGYCSLSSAANPDGLVSSVDVTLKNLQNQANISGSSYVGGIMGGSMYVRNDAGAVVTATYEGVVNTGNVTAEGDFAGGLAGYVCGDVLGMNSAMCWNIFDCENQGAITGKANVGGLFGGFLNGEHGYQGWSENTVTIDGCSSTGTVTGESDTGEIIGLDQIVR